MCSRELFQQGVATQYWLFEPKQGALLLQGMVSNLIGGTVGSALLLRY